MALAELGVMLVSEYIGGAASEYIGGPRTCPLDMMEPLDSCQYDILYLFNLILSYDTS